MKIVFIEDLEQFFARCGKRKNHAQILGHRAFDPIDAVCDQVIALDTAAGVELSFYATLKELNEDG